MSKKTQGHFEVDKIIDFNKIASKDRIEESDYSLLDNNNRFIQLKYKPPKEKDESGILAQPGIFSIKIDKYDEPYLHKLDLPEEKIVEDYQFAQRIQTFITSFFSKLHIYKKHGITQPRRGALIYGPAGTGKTCSIRLAIKDVIKDGKTMVIFWSTDRYKSGFIKQIFEFIDYGKVVEKVVLVVEDIGGSEYDKGIRESESSLLSILDNAEGTFKLPTAILATTNFPETLLANLTDRPGRFDEKINVGFPTSDNRVKLLRFFLKEKVTKEFEEEIRNKKYDEFSAAHLKEIILRAELNDLTYMAATKQLLEEQQQYKNYFKKKNKVGI